MSSSGYPLGGNAYEFPWRNDNVGAGHPLCGRTAPGTRVPEHLPRPERLCPCFQLISSGVPGEVITDVETAVTNWDINLKPVSHAPSPSILHPLLQLDLLQGPTCAVDPAFHLCLFDTGALWP